MLIRLTKVNLFKSGAGFMQECTIRVSAFESINNHGKYYIIVCNIAEGVVRMFALMTG